jgi:hypothetical protein
MHAVLSFVGSGCCHCGMATAALPVFDTLVVSLEPCLFPSVGFAAAMCGRVCVRVLSGARRSALLLVASILQEHVCPGIPYCADIVQGTHHMARAHHARLVSMLLLQQQIQFWPIYKGLSQSLVQGLYCASRALNPLRKLRGHWAKILPVCLTGRSMVWRAAATFDPKARR